LFRIVLIFVSIYDECDVIVFLKKSEIVLLSWFSPLVKKFNILLMMISLIGNVSMIWCSRFERACWSKSSNLRLHTLHAVHKSTIFGSSKFQNWLPYNDEHWLRNNFTFACHAIYLNLFMMTLVRIFISLIILSIFTILCPVWIVCPRCFWLHYFYLVSTNFYVYIIRVIFHSRIY